MSTRGCHVTVDVTEQAVGCVEAQNLIAGLQGDSICSDHAWLAFVQLAARFGWRSAACRAFVLELAKRSGAHC